jgi:hypothetical protein
MMLFKMCKSASACWTQTAGRPQSDKCKPDMRAVKGSGLPETPLASEHGPRRLDAATTKYWGS